MEAVSNENSYSHSLTASLESILKIQHFVLWFFLTFQYIQKPSSSKVGYSRMSDGPCEVFFTVSTSSVKRVRGDVVVLIWHVNELPMHSWVTVTKWGHQFTSFPVPHYILELAIELNKREQDQLNWRWITKAPRRPPSCLTVTLPTQPASSSQSHFSLNRLPGSSQHLNPDWSLGRIIFNSATLYITWSPP